VTRVGVIDAAPGLRFVDAGGHPLELAVAGFDHFAGA
jgi:thiamine-monophosphate kinase